jgi:hypothetical protein
VVVALAALLDLSQLRRGQEILFDSSLHLLTGEFSMLTDTPKRNRLAYRKWEEKQ